MVSKIPDETSSNNQKNPIKTTPSKIATIFDVVNAFLEFFTIDFSIPNNQISFFDAFLPLFNSLIDVVTKSNQFSSNELESCWMFFQNEFRKASHSLLSLNLKDTVLELINKSKQIQVFGLFSEILTKLFHKYEAAAQFIDYQGKSAVCFGVYQDCTSLRQEFFKQIENSQKKSWQDIIPNDIYILMKYIEESMLFYCKISRLKELVIDVSSQKDFVANTLKTNVDSKKFFENMTRVINIILRSMFLSQLSDNDINIFLNLFSEINKITILSKTQIYYSLFENWSEFSKNLKQILKISPTNEEEKAFNSLQEEIKKNGFGIPQITFYLIDIETKYSEIKKSPQNYLFSLNLFTVLSQIVGLSESMNLRNAVLNFRNFITKRIYCLSCFKILENSFELIKLHFDKESSKTYQFGRALTNAYEQIQILGMKTNPQYEHHISRYKCYLTSIKAISKIDGYEKQLSELLKWHPKADIVEKYFIPIETVEKHLSEMEMISKKSPLNGQIEKLQKFQIGTQNYSEKMSLIFESLLSNSMIRKDISDCYLGLEEFLNTVKLLDSKNDLIIREKAEGITPQVELIDTGISLVKNSNLSREEKAELVIALANLNLYTMYKNFDENEVKKLTENVLLTLKVPYNTDVVRSIFSLMNYLDLLNERNPLDFYDEFYQFFTSLLVGQFPEFETIEQKIALFVTKVESDSLDFELEEIKNYISNQKSFIFICQKLIEPNPRNIMRYCFDFSIFQYISKELKFLLEYNLICNDKKIGITLLLSEIDSMMKCNLKNFINDFEAHKIPEILLSKLDSLWPFVNFKKLYLSFSSQLEILFSLISSSNFLKSIDFNEKLTKSDKLLKEFSFIQNKLTLYDIHGIISDIPQMVLDKLTKNRQYRNSFEVVMFRKKISVLIHYVSSVLFMMNVTFSQNPEMYNLILNFRHVELQNDSSLFKNKNNFYLFSLADEISQYDVSRIHFEESQNVNKQIKEEINQMKSKIDHFEENKQNKINFEAERLKEFEKELEIAKTNKQKATENTLSLKMKKNQLKDELISFISSKREMNKSENKMSAALSLLVDDDISQTEDYNSFDDLLIENLKTNLRLKKTIELMKYPKIKPLFNAKEFYELIDKFKITNNKETESFEVISKHQNNKVSLLRNLSNLNEERDLLFRQVVSENKNPTEKRTFQTEDYYRMMVALSKTEINEETPKKSQKDFFIEFAETSDAFLLEINEEIKSLEDEISSLEGNTQTESGHKDINLLKEKILNFSELK
ncbi:hypothetical protein TVAG_305860 [Trichomonas vaginalis G3]|uniref:Uncharacterized protein n=1 Tax=Trichomonas vaginalis (strain ATCC PRA-98 / G3) TaxID=412133 RepID=A2DN78_TRIV3|nr:hypothetical protein TVAGG3_1023960 [Trichomonas vaginalis G3]EAY18066.1 hypothetical protein TVAG_305860 [Trichomonas vaginalis G3]KAI5492341.1 hypothetical protein TVAGG3_1023960 [Trichomonas vaginalis G3]|eukprot:XP_001579052.1 hypothetical protein [Trichomonas vaginalis G3]